MYDSQKASAYGAQSGAVNNTGDAMNDQRSSYYNPQASMGGLAGFSQPTPGYMAGQEQSYQQRPYWQA